MHLDEYSLPEPQITITPENANRTYHVNEQIGVKCTVHSDRMLNLDLLIGKTLVINMLFLRQISFCINRYLEDTYCDTGRLHACPRP